MMAFIWKLIVGGLWKSILKGLALVGLYGKARLDQKRADQLNALKAKDRTIEEVLRETPSDDHADAIRQRMSDRSKQP